MVLFRDGGLMPPLYKIFRCPTCTNFSSSSTVELPTRCRAYGHCLMQPIISLSSKIRFEQILSQPGITTKTFATRQAPIVPNLHSFRRLRKTLHKWYFTERPWNMDESAVNLTRQHYDRHAGGDPGENMRRRARGPALPLKKFHNHIKESLIRRFCYGIDKLLDLCCGRGGDVQKWDRSKVKYAKGVDLSAAEIKEAWERYSSHLQRNRGCAMTAEFEDTGVLGVSKFDDANAPYDTVTCFFALHYFLVTEEAVHNFMSNVARNLKKGGYFIGTCPDGKRVVSALKNSRHRHKVDTKMLKIQPKWEGDYQCFGSAYTCAITDTVTEGLEGSVGSFEYLVFTGAVKAIAAKYGLKLVNEYGDEDLGKCFDGEDNRQPFKHFNPEFRDSDESLEQASRLNMAFVFQKVADYRKAGKFYTVEDLEKYETTLPDLPPQHQNYHNQNGKRNRHRQGGRRNRFDDEGASNEPNKCRKRDRDGNDADKGEVQNGNGRNNVDDSGDQGRQEFAKKEEKGN